MTILEPKKRKKMFKNVYDKPSVHFYFLQDFLIYDRKSHDTCSTSNVVHPPFKGMISY